MLERRFPADFGRPEARLNLAVQTNVNATNGSDTTFQTVVLSDLEFSQLRNHEHHPEQSIREVKSEVAPELSGSLVKQGVSNAVVISESRICASGPLNLVGNHLFFV